MDEPLTHSNSAGIYWLCREAKRSITVLLTGEGADELFGGYRRYESLRKSLLARRWLSPIAPLVRFVPQTSRTSALRRALAGSTSEVLVRNTAVGGYTLRRHIEYAAQRRAFTRREAFLGRPDGRDWLVQALYYDLKTFLPPVLMRQDRMSMAHSVETRTPFLDHRLVQLAFQLPLKSKLRHGTGKRIVKDIAARYVPRDLIFRPKVGFGFPLGPWMRSNGGLGARLGDITDSQSLSAQIFPGAMLRQLVDDHRSARIEQSDALWTLLALESWHRSMGNRAGPGSDSRASPAAVTPAG